MRLTLRTWNSWSGPNLRSWNNISFPKLLLKVKRIDCIVFFFTPDTNSIVFMSLFPHVSCAIALRIGLWLGSRSKRNLFVQKTWGYLYTYHIYLHHISQDVEQESSSCSSTISFVWSVYGNDYQNITENPNYIYYSVRISVGIICCLPYCFVQEIWVMTFVAEIQFRIKLAACLCNSFTKQNKWQIS
jgi:hypothetical protein